MPVPSIVCAARKRCGKGTVVGRWGFVLRVGGAMAVALAVISGWRGDVAVAGLPGQLGVIASRCEAMTDGGPTGCVLADGVLVEVTQDSIDPQSGITNEAGLLFDVTIGGTVTVTVLAGGPEGYDLVQNPIVLAGVAEGSTVEFIFVLQTGGGGGTDPDPTPDPGPDPTPIPTPIPDSDGGNGGGGEEPGGGGEIPGPDTGEVTDPDDSAAGGNAVPAVIVSALPNTGAGPHQHTGLQAAVLCLVLGGWIAVCTLAGVRLSRATVRR